MKSITIKIAEKRENIHTEMVKFYNKATEDYEHWSKDFNMHFGYYIPFKTSLLKRDSMLNEMNYQVIKRLQILKGEKILADLGCGMGGTMKYALKKNKKLSAIGVTLSDFQTKKGNDLLKGFKGTIIKENYNRTSLLSNTFDAAIALESFCHSGHSKNSLKEAYRILKPNGKIIIADAFLKKPVSSLCNGSLFAYKKLCDHWSLEKLESIDNMILKFKAEGFSKIDIEDASFRVAPSVLHVPFAIIAFVLKKILNSKTLKGESLHNLKGSFYALLSGLHMKSFGYYIITATK